MGYSIIGPSVSRLTYGLDVVAPPSDSTQLDPTVSSLLTLIPFPVRLEPLLSSYRPSSDGNSPISSLSPSERRLLRADILNAFADDSAICRVFQLDGSISSLIHQRELIERSIGLLQNDLNYSIQQCAPVISAFLDRWLKGHPSSETAPATPLTAPIPSASTAAPTPATVPPPVITTSGPQVPAFDVEDAVSLGSSDDEYYAVHRK